MDTRIIALGHRKRTGKDTAAKMLAELIPNSRIVGLADEVKKTAYNLFFWAGLKEGDYYEDHPDEREILLPLLGKTPRQLWIGVGNGVREATGCDDVWYDIMREKNRDIPVLIVKDLRFPREGVRVKQDGGICYRIDNNRIPQVTDGADERMADWDGWDGIIENHGSLGDLQDTLCGLVAALNWGKK